MCEPPRRPRMRKVSRIARCRRRVSASSRVSAGRTGIDAGPPQHLVAEQVAEAGDPRLVHEHGLDRRAAPGDDRARAAAASGRTRRDRAGPRRDRAPPRRAGGGRAGTGCRRRRTTSRSGATPTPAGCSRRASGSPAASPSISTRPLIPRWRPSTGPPSVSTRISLPRRRAVSELRAAQRGRTAARRQPPLQEPRVGRVHLLDRAVQRARVDELASGLDFEDLRQGRGSEVRDRAALGSLRQLGVLRQEPVRVSRLHRLPGAARGVRARRRRRGGRWCARPRRSRSGRPRRRARSARRRPLRARRARRRSRACHRRSGRR